MTYRERLIAGLTAMGYVRVITASNKYDAFRKDARLLFIGVNGALRAGRTASNNHSIGDPSNQTPFYQRVLANGTPKQATLQSFE